MKKVFLATMITAMLVLTSALAGATNVTIGTITGSGTATLDGSGQPTSYSFGGAFNFDTTPLYPGGPSLASPTIMNDLGQYGFAASSSPNLPAWDYNSYQSPALFRGNFPWILSNGPLGPLGYGSTLYGSVMSFAFAQAVPGGQNPPYSAAVTGTLMSDGFVHWYYGYDSTPGPPAGMTSLAALGVNSNFDFNGIYTITSDIQSTNLAYTLTGTLTGTTVPEPATMLLLGLGLVGIAGIRRKFSI